MFNFSWSNISQSGKSPCAICNLLPVCASACFLWLAPGCNQSSLCSFPHRLSLISGLFPTLTPGKRLSVPPIEECQLVVPFPRGPPQQEPCWAQPLDSGISQAKDSLRFYRVMLMQI